MFKTAKAVTESNGVNGRKYDQRLWLKLCMYMAYIGKISLKLIVIYIIYEVKNRDIWSNHTSRCIVVLSVLLDDYTTVYACCW